MAYAKVAAVAAALIASSFGANVEAQVVPDLVSRTALRVCADPANLPFSSRTTQGFENKVADIVAGQLKEPVRYFWAPSGPGFVRNTLAAAMCDVVMGYTIGAEMVQSTNPYYRSTYAIVAPKGSPLNGVVSMEDPKLKKHTIGVFAATPPVDVMLSTGLMGNAKLYPLIVDHRYASPLSDMLKDLESKNIDAVIAWGPMIGSAVKQSGGKLVLSPLLKDVDKPGFAYRISFGIRHEEPEWKHRLEGVIRARQADINKVLDDYGVPLIDDSGKLIPPETATNAAAAPRLQPASASARPDKRASAPVPKSFKMPGPAPTNGSAAQSPQ